MVELEYESTKIKVPQSWDDIPLGLYERFYTQTPETHRERVAVIATACECDAETLLNWPTAVFSKIVSYLGFLFEDVPTPATPQITIDGKIYVVPIEEQLSLGAWVDADDIQKKGEAVLSNVLAIVCRPVGEKYDCDNNDARAAMFAAQPVTSIWGVLAFFLQYNNELKKHTEVYLALRQLADLLPRNIKLLRSRGAGIKRYRIWQVMKYLILIKLLDYQLQRFLRSFNTYGIKTRPKTLKDH